MIQYTQKFANEQVYMYKQTTYGAKILLILFKTCSNTSYLNSIIIVICIDAIDSNNMMLHVYLLQPLAFNYLESQVARSTGLIRFASTHTLFPWQLCITINIPYLL